MATTHQNQFSLWYTLDRPPSGMTHVTLLYSGPAPTFDTPIVSYAWGLLVCLGHARICVGGHWEQQFVNKSRAGAKYLLYMPHTALSTDSEPPGYLNTYSPVSTLHSMTTGPLNSCTCSWLLCLSPPTSSGQQTSDAELLKPQLSSQEPPCTFCHT